MSQSPLAALNAFGLFAAERNYDASGAGSNAGALVVTLPSRYHPSAMTDAGKKLLEAASALPEENGWSWCPSSLPA
jgi:hypothetical protein